MWKKALALFLAAAVVVVVLAVLLELAGAGALANALSYGVSAFFAVRANIDYYKKMVLNENGWW
jgi:preprotein translocase subunit SecG